MLNYIKPVYQKKRQDNQFLYIYIAQQGPDFFSLIEMKRKSHKVPMVHVYTQHDYEQYASQRRLIIKNHHHHNNNGNNNQDILGRFICQNQQLIFKDSYNSLILNSNLLSLSFNTIVAVVVVSYCTKRRGSVQF